MSSGSAISRNRWYVSRRLASSSFVPLLSCPLRASLLPTPLAWHAGSPSAQSCLLGKRPSRMGISRRSLYEDYCSGLIGGRRVNFLPFLQRRNDRPLLSVQEI